MEYPTIVLLTDNAFDLNRLLAQITLPTTGASAIFTGIVRGKASHGDSHDTDFLEYETYSTMAEEKMNQVAKEIRKNWPSVEGIAIFQRTGRLYPGEISTVIACTSAHRNSGAFEAVRYGIDRLKEIVPIWKKETGPDGQVWVEGHYHPRPGE